MKFRIQIFISHIQMRELIFLIAFLFFSSGSAGASPTDPGIIANIISLHSFYKPDLQSIPDNSLNELISYLSIMDPPSHYWSEAEYLEEKNSIIHDHGMGVSITAEKNEKLTIVPYQNSPAFFSGITSPMEISEINGKTNRYKTIQELTSLVKASKAINIKGYDLVDHQSIEATIQLGPYDSPSVEIFQDNEILIIRIYLFIERVTFNRLREILEFAVKKNLEVVIDLRYSAGGSFFEAVDCVSLFMPLKKTLAKLKFDDEKIIGYVGRNNVLAYFKYIYILTSNNTASAAEVFARALQYYEYANVVGQVSQGKCTTQQLFDLPNGDGLKLTVGQILGPDDRFCEGKGIRPDISFPGNIHNTNEIIEKIRSVSSDRMMETEP